MNNNDYNNIPTDLTNRKNNNLLTILIIVIALLLIGAGVGIYLVLNKDNDTRRRVPDESRNFGMSVDTTTTTTAAEAAITTTTTAAAESAETTTTTVAEAAATTTTTALSPEIVYVPVEVATEAAPVETVPVAVVPVEKVPAATVPNDVNVSVDNSGDNVDMYPAFYSAFATSELAAITNNDGTFTYSPSNVLDSRHSTCWSEGVVGSGINESIVLSSERKQHVSAIDIYNGLYTNSELFYKNNRIKDCRIEVSDGSTFDVTLDGDYYAQPNTVNFSYPVDTEYIKITILSVYGGNKYDDTCVSEISVR